MNLPNKTKIKTQNIKLKLIESVAIETDVKPKYVNTKASAILLIILDTILDSSLAWNDKL